MGGSLAGALKALSDPPAVFGTTKNPEDRALALDRGWVDSFYESNLDAAGCADLVVLCVPPAQVAEIWQELGGRLSGQTVLTDLSSVKGSLFSIYQARFSEVFPDYVSSHPMAGSERSGFRSSQAHLFHGRTVFLTPYGREGRSLELLKAFWRVLGAGEVPVVTASDHDGIVAHISHLPHVLSYTLFHLVEEIQRKNLYAGFDWNTQKGGSFSDVLRIARSSPSLWADILHQNRTAVLKSIDAYTREISQIRRAISTMDSSELSSLLEAWTATLKSRHAASAPPEVRG
jgi:prephenate dehydrogenase